VLVTAIEMLCLVADRSALLAARRSGGPLTLSSFEDLGPPRLSRPAAEAGSGVAVIA